MFQIKTFSASNGDGAISSVATKVDTDCNEFLARMEEEGHIIHTITPTTSFGLSKGNYTTDRKVIYTVTVVYKMVFRRKILTEHS